MKKQTLHIQDVPGGKRFYIEGDLQFDTRDEGIYHEFLGAAGALVAQNYKKAPLNALVLGGGDGLVLRDILSSSDIMGAQLVDRDEDVINYAMNEFSSWNRKSLGNPKVKVLIEDAGRFLRGSSEVFDLVVADFTFPNTLEGAGLYTREFFSLVREHLSSCGVFATNAVSPSKTPTAFRAIIKTLSSVDFDVIPMKVKIPSFLESGYGMWGFLIGSPAGIPIHNLKQLSIPGHLRYLSARTLKEALSGYRRERFASAAFSRPIIYPSDLLSLISIDLAMRGADDEFVRRVVFSLRQIDLPALMKEIEKYIGELPLQMREELAALKDNLADALFSWRTYKVISVLFILMIFINAVYPDNAYAKGYVGSGSSHSESSAASDFFWTASSRPTPFHFTDRTKPIGSGIFRMNGVWKPVKSVSIWSGDKKRENIFMSLSDNLSVSESGKLVVPICGSNYNYEVLPEKLILLDENGIAIHEIPMDEQIRRDFTGNFNLQKSVLERTIREYENWLKWANPLYKIFEESTRESQELQKLKDMLELFRKLETLILAEPFQIEADKSLTRLAPGIYMAAGGDIYIQQANGALKLYPTEAGSGSGAGGMTRTEAMNRFLVKILACYRLTGAVGQHSSQSTNKNVPKPQAHEHLNAAYNFYKQGNFLNALAEYNKAIEDDPNNNEAYYNRGVTFLKTGENDKALSDFKRSIELDPHHFQSYRNLDWVLFKQREWETIINYWSEFIQLEPQHAQAYLERGGAYYHQGNWDAALKDIKKSCDLGNSEGCMRYKQLKEKMGS